MAPSFSSSSAGAGSGPAELFTAAISHSVLAPNYAGPPPRGGSWLTHWVPSKGFDLLLWLWPSVSIGVVMRGREKERGSERKKKKEKLPSGLRSNPRPLSLFQLGQQSLASGLFDLVAPLAAATAAACVTLRMMKTGSGGGGAEWGAGGRGDTYLGTGETSQAQTSSILSSVCSVRLKRYRKHWADPRS